MTTRIIVTTSGEVRFVWSDSLAWMRTLGRLFIRRASHVEPDSNGQWVADLSPVNGPQLGPYALRRDALAAEVAWLRSNGY
jgi:hypothetical protein